MSLKRQEGFALIAVMGLAALVTVVAIGGFVLSQQVLHESSRVQNESKAFQVAQSGLDRELAGFTEANLVDGAFERSGSTSDGVYTVTVAALAGSEFEYVMTSAGTADGEEESVSMRFFYLDLWNMNIGAGESAAMGGGRGWNGNASIDGPLYVRGDLEWSANAVYEGGPLFIRDGGLDVSGSGELGKADPIKLYATDGIIDGANQVYLDGPISSSVPDIDLPWIDEAFLDNALQTAMDESVDNFMGVPSRILGNTEATGANPATYPSLRALSSPASTSEYYKYIGPSAGRSDLNDGSTFMEIDSVSFGSWDGNGYPVGSGKHDDFAYDFGAGTLYVEGTVFIDGDLHIGPSVHNYVGNGTLIVNGDIFIGAEFGPRDGLAAEQAIGLVAAGDIVIGDNAHSGNVRAHYTGAIFCNGTVELYHTATSYEGSILAANIYGDKPDIHLTTNPVLPTVLPESMPGAGGGIVFPGTWTRN